MSERQLTLFLALSWTLLLLGSCLLPPSLLPPLKINSFFQLDKLVHLLFFWILAFLWLHLWVDDTVKFQQRLLVLVFCSLFGLLIELIQQSQLIGRSFEWADLTADTIGAGLGVLYLKWNVRLYLFVKKHLPFVN